MFDPIFNGNTARTRRPLAVALSFAGQIVVVGLAVLVPVLRPEGIALGGLLRVITAPPGTGDLGPIKQKAPPHTGDRGSGPRVFVEQVLRQPSRVPPTIAIGDSEPPALAPEGPAGAGVPGSTGDVPWGMGVNVSPPPPPAPPHPTPPPARAVPRLKVGGIVQAAKLVHQVLPVYPPLARQARISGTVRLEAVIDRSGVIQSLQLISGHPLLAQAALDAVRQWTYQPTLLNGEPVEVLTQIEVNFKLGE